MQVGLIGCGNMARALARGWGRPLVCADPVAERAQALAARGRRRGARHQRRGRRARRPRRALPQARAARRMWPRSRACRQGRRLDPRGHAARGAAAPPIPSARSTASSRRCPWRSARARSCRPPIRPRAGAGEGRSATRRGRERAVRRARHARRARRRAAGRRHGPDVVRARLRRAGRRGADRRGREPRASPPRRARSSSCRRSQARPSCCARATTTRWPSAARSPRPAASPRAALDALERGGLRAAFSDALDAVLGRLRRDRSSSPARAPRSPTTCRR